MTSRQMIANRTYGPSPWYVCERSLCAGDRSFEWAYAGPREPFGSAVLREPSQRVVMVLPMYAYIHPLPNGRLLVWQPEPKPAGEKSDHMQFAVVDIGNE